MPAAPSELVAPRGQGKDGHTAVPRVAQKFWPQLLLLDRFSHHQLLHEHVPTITHHDPTAGAEHEPLGSCCSSQTTGSPAMSYSLPTLTLRPADRKKSSYFIIKCIAKQLRKVWQYFAAKVVNIHCKK